MPMLKSIFLTFLQAVMMNALIEACVEELNKRDVENSMRRTNHTVMGGLLR